MQLFLVEGQLARPLTSGAFFSPKGIIHSKEFTPITKLVDTNTDEIVEVVTVFVRGAEFFYVLESEDLCLFIVDEECLFLDFIPT